MGTHIKLYSTVKSWSINHFLSVTIMNFVKPDVLPRRDQFRQRTFWQEEIGV
ncbi:hypothetical protein LEP1GSC008_2781 [Leptospira kirschneri serovar Bulgarica str. Nikolaevo]|uniref:Uncharacterized protein n=1 Tax=Leptospira kirschneri serovar Bulgarica str. Nikolaevo TaxID=1240687 RepID=M6FAP2_9LEPT|nr:hypothetical protein LEP1GSC008_2781 [Leptospira kirschneri serovar Bulgarica str. Nikolaevo]